MNLNGSETWTSKVVHLLIIKVFRTSIFSCQIRQSCAHVRSVEFQYSSFGNSFSRFDEENMKALFLSRFICIYEFWMNCYLKSLCLYMFSIECAERKSNLNILISVQYNTRCMLWHCTYCSLYNILLSKCYFDIIYLEIC